MNFIKIPHTLKQESVEIQTLWALSSYFLTIPNFKGSIKKIVKSSVRTNTNFMPVWNILRDKYLKIAMIPCGENRFEARYELYATERPDIENTRYLTSAKAREYILNNPNHKVFNNGYFTAVSVDVMRDNSLTLKAKGLFIELRRLFDLQKNIKNISITKNELMKRLHLKRSSTDSAWNELKAAGYLHQTRYCDETTGLFGWGYELYSVAEKSKIIPADKVAAKRNNNIIETEKPKDVALSPAERLAIRNAIKHNIEYDVLIESAGKHEISYTTDDINSLLQIMVDTVCTTKEFVKINSEMIPSQAVRSALMSVNADDIISLLSRFNETEGKIRNIRAYKLTALYNSAYSQGIAVI